MYKVDAKYKFLNDVGTLPRILQAALPLLGVQEVVGKGSNATILGWRDELNKSGHTVSGFTDDDIAWCGLFAAVTAFRAGKLPVANPLWARNWLKFGTQVADAVLGDCLVFSRPGGGGHVGWYVAEDATHYHVLGGNQSNRVTIARIEKKRCIGIRRPAMKVPPSSAKAYWVAAQGLVTSNEA